MKQKLVIFLSLTLIFNTLQAQHELMDEALREFSFSRFWLYEDLPVTWNMEGKIQANLNEGINNLMEGRPDLAEADLTVVLEKDPTIWQAFYFRAAARKQMDKLEDSREDLERALQLHPDFYEGYVEMAKIHFLHRNVIDSERMLRKAIQRNKSKPAAYYLRGDINLVQNQTKDAIKNYQECLSVDSLFHDARIKLALIDLMIKNDQPQAVDQLTRVLKIDSLQKTALLFRAILLYEKDKKQSLKDLSNVVIVEPQHLMAFFLRGTIYAELDDFDHSFSDFQTVIKGSYISDNHFAGKQTWMDKKIDIQNVGAYTLTRVYGLSDQDAIKIKQAYCCIITRQLDRSISLIDQTSAPETEPLSMYLKAVAYEHKGSHQSAFTFYNKALKLDNEIVDAHKKRGIYAQELKQWPLSIRDFTFILKMQPDGFIIHKLRGVSYYHNKEYDLAIADYNAYLAKDSVNMEVIGFRGMAYQLNHQQLKAYVDFARSGNFHAINYAKVISLADSLLAIGDTIQTLQALDVITYATPEFTEGYALKFKTHLARQEWGPIEENILRAIENSPTNPRHYQYKSMELKKPEYSYLLTLQAMIFVKNQRQEDALNAFAEAIKTDKKNALAYLERGKAFQTIGKTSKAKDDFENASQLGNEDARKLLSGL